LVRRFEMKNLGNILLAVWLILVGLLPLLNLRFSGSDLILPVLAIAAGVLILVGRGRVKLSGNLGVLLLGVWLILYGVLPLLKISFPAAGVVLGVLAIAAGVLLLLNR
jgi:hypothetical protein